MNKTLKTIIGWVLYVAFLVGLVYGIPKGLTYLLDTPYPMASITSGSMWPSLKRGDLILIKGVEEKGDVSLGDIVIYKNPNGFTIHRVIEVNENTVVTKGDANNVSDSPVRYEEIIGKTLAFNGKPVRIPFFGQISIFLNRERLAF